MRISANIARDRIHFMPGVKAASRPHRHSAIAFLLCLLAFSCAMEAKIAWYEPAAGPTIDARSTKAMPADIRDSSQDDFASADAASAPISFLILAIFSAAWLQMGEQAPGRLLITRIHRVPSTSFFSPQISFRPPPQF